MCMTTVNTVLSPVDVPERVLKRGDPTDDGGEFPSPPHGRVKGGQLIAARNTLKEGHMLGPAGRRP
jgi:hypothetical protein